MQKASKLVSLWGESSTNKSKHFLNFKLKMQIRKK